MFEQEADIQNFISDYTENQIPTAEMCIKYNISMSYLYKIVKELGISRRNILKMSMNNIRKFKAKQAKQIKVQNSDSDEEPNILFEEDSKEKSDKKSKNNSKENLKKSIKAKYGL